MRRTRYTATALLALYWVTMAQGAIYRWTDAEGRVHFSDRPPLEVQQEARDLSAALVEPIPFKVDIIPVDYTMPGETHTKVEIAVAKIHEVLGSRLGLRFRTDPSFAIRIFEDRDSFAGYGHVAVAHVAAGYYSSERNEAVTWRQQSFEQMLQVITHEASHALLHHRFDDVPPWLNEGLSEYFERMQVFGQAVSIPVNAEWDALIKSQLRDGSITPLTDYVDLDYQDWLARNLPDNRSYAQAWSLVYFMMSTAEGTRLLARLLEGLDSAAAGRFPSAQAIESGYPGGLAAFETAWHAWAFGPKPPHLY
jgi:hypothetical protein